MTANKKTLGELTTRKIYLRIVPYFLILYVIAFIDRMNIGYVALDMNTELALTSTSIGLIAGIFFIGYFFFEVPSNILMNRYGARKWISRILITWGFICIVTGFVQDVTQLYFLRFLLGVAEAGFYPAVILYFTLWLPKKELARAVALFMIGMPLANIIGAPLSTWIMDNISWFELSGWRWVFVMEGFPAVLFGILNLFLLTDLPEQAKWLSREEKDWLKAELDNERVEVKDQKEFSSHRKVFVNILKDSKIWILIAIYLPITVANYGVATWLPTIIKSFSSSLTNYQIGLITLIPYILGGIAMVLWAFKSDRTGERKFHTAVTPLVAAIGLLGAALTSNYLLSMVMICIAVIGLYSFFGPYWPLTTEFLSLKTAAIGIAFINSIANLGGFIGPYFIGFINDATQTTKSGLFFIVILLVVSFISAISIKKDKDILPVDRTETNPSEAAGN
ncbi:MFS transporter [Niallia oryzisoli]|uniref:MFS transporter n=1 Tax=Niallia oryzisoli TaxID=1737571 RepID=A0ABZ2CHF4_9BACI